MREIELKALAKINLALDVLGRRENGYHDVKMVMQTIYLYDDVKLEIREEAGIVLESNLIFLPTDERNIAYKAAKLLMDEFRVKQGVKITLKKRIPVAAGLAGGSANAAAVLWGVNRLFHLRLSNKELMDRGEILGADVPYCIMRGTVLAEGIGEILTPLNSIPKCYIVIAKPAAHVSTKEVYEKLDAVEIHQHPDIAGMLEAIEKNDLMGIANKLGNVLEEVTITDYPVIEEIKDVMKEHGALNAMMSGSGPTVFGIFTDKDAGQRAIRHLNERGIVKQVFLTNVHCARRK